MKKKRKYILVISILIQSPSSPILFIADYPQTDLSLM